MNDAANTVTPEGLKMGATYTRTNRNHVMGASHPDATYRVTVTGYEPGRNGSRGRVSFRYDHGCNGVDFADDFAARWALVSA